MRSLIRMEKVVSEPLDIHETMTRATQLIGQRLKAHDIRFDLVLSRRMPLVMAHATSIEQVLINLVANAMFALDETDQEDKWIQVRTRKHGRFCRIEVSDNGPGIPEAHLSRIFDSLFTTRENGEGHGPGAAHRPVFALPDRGERPCGPIGRTEAPASSSTFPWPLNRGERFMRIILAEDHESIRKSLAEFLSDTQHEVKVCANGQEALGSVSQLAGSFDPVRYSDAQGWMDSPCSRR